MIIAELLAAYLLLGLTIEHATRVDGPLIWTAVLLWPVLIILLIDEVAH